MSRRTSSASKDTRPTTALAPQVLLTADYRDITSPRITEAPEPFRQPPGVPKHFSHSAAESASQAVFFDGQHDVVCSARCNIASRSVGSAYAGSRPSGLFRPLSGCSLHSAPHRECRHRQVSRRARRPAQYAPSPAGRYPRGCVASAVLLSRRVTDARRLCDGLGRLRSFPEVTGHDHSHLQGAPS